MKVVPKMKISIIGGGGVVGSSSAYRIALDGKASEIVLVDTQRNLSEAHALDIEQAITQRGTTRVYVGEITDTHKSDIIIIAASGPHRTSQSSRAEFLPQNLTLTMKLVGELISYSPSALWLFATVPVDPIVYLAHQTFSLPRQKIIGINQNDSFRFQWAISKILSVPSTGIEAFVLGEHGETRVLVFSNIQVNGKKISLNQDQMDRITEMAMAFLPQWRKWQPGRTAGWTTAESIGGIVSSIISDDGRIWTCSTPLEEEYGLQKVSLGVPVRLSPKGVKEIIELDLDTNEKERLKTSAQAIREQIKQGQYLLKNIHG
jgi:malate dehydrogenase